MGASIEWAQYILDHRTVKEEDPCPSAYKRPHGDIVTGPMADNDTGEIIKEFIETGDKDGAWLMNDNEEWIYNDIQTLRKRFGSL